MRAMASVVEVNEVIPIENCDKIQVIKNAQNNYNVIGSKDIKVGDKLVYVEVDSILPVETRFEFLRKRCYKENLGGFLIKNMKMRGVYSNGILFRFEELGIKEKKVGTDLTKELGIRKYEPEDDASPTKFNPFKAFLFKHVRWLGRLLYSTKRVSEDFPTWLIDKSDEDNIQNNKQWFDFYKLDNCYITEKMEGNSQTILFNPKTNKVEFFGRNKTSPENFIAWCKEKGYDKTLKSLSTHYAIQGENVREGVQKHIYKNGSHFYVYTVKDLDQNRLLSLEEMKVFCKDNGFEMVPMIYENVRFGILFKDINDMQDFTEHLWFKVGTDEPIDDRKTKIDKKSYHRCEGIVVRSVNQDWSFKVKSNEYLIAGL